MWICAAALALAACTAVPRTSRPAEEFALPDRLVALGTEPFWSATVAGTRLTYSTPTDEKGRIVLVTRSGGVDHATLEGVLDGRPFRLRVTAGPCSDGMSDNVYPFAVERTMGDSLERGCARAG